jgi:hypothetical protein
LLSGILAGILGHPEMTGLSGLFWNSFFPVAGDRNRNPEKTTKQDSGSGYWSITRVPLEVVAVTLLPKNYYSSISTVVGNACKEKQMRQQRKTGILQEHETKNEGVSIEQRKSYTR